VECCYWWSVSCKWEDGNCFDPLAVAVCNGDIVIGRVPRKISSICSLYIHRGAEIHCRVTGSRRFSADLEQGGLGLNFRSLNFRMVTWHTNYTKISRYTVILWFHITYTVCILTTDYYITLLQRYVSILGGVGKTQQLLWRHKNAAGPEMTAVEPSGSYTLLLLLMWSSANRTPSDWSHDCT